MKIYNKLVRDKIPEIIKSNGDNCETKILNDEDYKKYLNKKLLEEVKEYLDSENIEELADLEEVIRAIIDNKNISYEDFEKLRKEKVRKRGSFKKKILLKITY